MSYLDHINNTKNNLKLIDELLHNDKYKDNVGLTIDVSLGGNEKLHLKRILIHSHKDDDKCLLQLLRNNVLMSLDDAMRNLKRDLRGLEEVLNVQKTLDVPYDGLIYRCKEVRSNNKICVEIYDINEGAYIGKLERTYIPTDEDEIGAFKGDVIDFIKKISK